MVRLIFLISAPPLDLIIFALGALIGTNMVNKVGVDQMGSRQTGMTTILVLSLARNKIYTYVACFMVASVLAGDSDSDCLFREKFSSVRSSPILSRSFCKIYI